MNQVRSRHPHIGGLLLAITDEPQSTTSWAIGAEGERKLGASLDGLAQSGVVLLHDRLRPGTTANIDHLAVAPTGVWVIDAKRYRGQVAKKDVGGWFSTDIRLYVGRRDCTELVVAMSKQVAAVRAALGAEWSEVPVRPMLCFVDAEWGWFAKLFDLDGVVVTWGKAARELLARPGRTHPRASSSWRPGWGSVSARRRAVRPGEAPDDLARLRRAAGRLPRHRGARYFPVPCRPNR